MVVVVVFPLLESFGEEVCVVGDFAFEELVAFFGVDVVGVFDAPMVVTSSWGVGWCGCLVWCIAWGVDVFVFVEAFGGSAFDVYARVGSCWRIRTTRSDVERVVRGAVSGCVSVGVGWLVRLLLVGCGATA
jgi:hypothetical protein